MTPERFRQVRELLRYSNADLADLLGRADERRIRRWASGAYPVPEDVAAWMEGMARHMSDNPPPQVRGRQE